jgi:two-component system, cell cycle response regulator
VVLANGRLRQLNARFASGPLLLGFAFGAIGLAVALQAAHALFDLGGPSLDGFFKDGIFTAAEFAAVAMASARVLLRRENRLAWGLISIGLLVWAGGDLVWTVWLNNLSHPPYPSIADALYLSMYPTIYCGLLLLMRAHFRHAGAAVWLDGLVVGLATAALGAAVIFPDVLVASQGGSAAVAVNLAYPLGDFLLLVFIAVGFTLSGWRPGRQWLILGIGLALSASADMIFVYQEAHGNYVAGHILDTMWPASMWFIALAAWQPARQASYRRAAVGHTIVFPVAFALIAFGLLISAGLHPLTHLALGLAAGAIFAAGVRATLTYLENGRMLRRQTEDAITDALTGLGNRRRLMEDLELAVDRGLRDEPSTLAFFDLNGFKRYNDSFGHGAGDALLTSLGRALAIAVGPQGEAYRLGGDEFCALLDGRFPRSDALVAKASAALCEQGSGFTVTASCGVVIVPEDATTVTTALGLADERMYADKGRDGRGTHSQTQSVLMQLLTEREPELHDHVHDVGLLAVAIGRRFELDSEQLDELRRAAELHDIGKLAIPEAILHKPAPLGDSEQRFIRQHTIIGERILNVAPALRMVSLLVRSSHERWDGAGYPDRLVGAEIPLGARIIAACDAYDAMTSARPYVTARTPEEALAELRRHAGSQFDPAVVRELCAYFAGLPLRHLESPRAQLPSMAEGPVDTVR